MARAKATQAARDMAGSRGSLKSVKRAIAPAAHGLWFATRHNRLSGEAAFIALVALAAGSGTAAGGRPGLREFAPVVGRVPAAGRARVAMRTRGAGAALRASGDGTGQKMPVSSSGQARKTGGGIVFNGAWGV